MSLWSFPTQPTWLVFLDPYSSSWLSLAETLSTLPLTAPACLPWQEPSSPGSVKAGLKNVALQIVEGLRTPLHVDQGCKQAELG